MGHAAVNYFDFRWAWVGQVDLILTNIGPVILYKIGLNTCGPCYYELNTTNKKNINIPRYW